MIISTFVNIFNKLLILDTQEIILRAKLSDYFSTIFEKELIDEIVKVGFLDKIKSGELLIDIDDTTCYDLGKEEEAYLGNFESQTSVNIDLLQKVLDAYM